MQVTVESLSSIKKKLNFSIPAEQVDREIERAYENIGKHATIKGFRKGKVPRAYLEKYYDDRMQEDVLKRLFNVTYFKAIADERIVPVAHPVIEGDEVKRGETYSFSATVEVMPEVSLKDYSGLEVQMEIFEPDPAAIETRLREMQESLAQLQPVTEDRPVANGDFALIDFQGFVDGVPFDKGAAEDFLLEVGSGRFIPGFEEQLIGMARGEEREIVVTFPADYGSAELAGKNATFRVMVKELKAKELPDLDDEFAKEFGEYESLAELRAKLEEIHQKQEQARIDNDFRERLVNELVRKNDLEVPEPLVERQLEMMLENARRRLAYQKMTLAMLGLDDERYKAQFRGMAEAKVKGALLLDALAEKEGIAVSDAEIDAQIQEVAERNGQDVAKLADFYAGNEEARRSLIAELREEKAIALLQSQAKVERVPRAEIPDGR